MGQSRVATKVGVRLAGSKDINANITLEAEVACGSHCEAR